MVDTHYDLLTIAYVCYLNNDYTKLKIIRDNINNNSGNIKCIFANLYFMSEEEMKEELHINYYKKEVSVVEMFKISKDILNHYFPDIDFIYSIEGCDYVSEEELDELYSLGLSSFTLVWNNENKYGSGNRTNKGLTKEGVSFIKHAIKLGLGIDLSHANENTFNDIINIIKKEKNKVVCFASHSNSRRLCDKDRNLTDEQLTLLKQVNGLVGIVSYTPFVSNNKSLSKQELQSEYLKHIIHVSNIIGETNIMLATDDMSFSKKHINTAIYDYNNLYNQIKNTLKIIYDDSKINDIMYMNVKEKIIDKLKERRNRNDRY